MSVWHASNLATKKQLVHFVVKVLWSTFRWCNKVLHQLQRNTNILLHSDMSIDRNWLTCAPGSPLAPTLPGIPLMPWEKYIQYIVLLLTLIILLLPTFGQEAVILNNAFTIWNKRLITYFDYVCLFRITLWKAVAYLQVHQDSYHPLGSIAQLLHSLSPLLLFISFAHCLSVLLISKAMWVHNPF